MMVVVDELVVGAAVIEGPTMDGHGFDSSFDDTKWTDGWLDVPIALIPPGLHSSGYRVERRVLEVTEVFGQPMRLAGPLECRLLLDPDGRLWMSDTPQERIMMYNNGRRSWGRVLVGGLGLGLYLQYAVAGAAGNATSFAVVEQSPVVAEIVGPTLHTSLSVAIEVSIAEVSAYLSEPPAERFDTVFLDTWETLDAAHLPEVNRLRELAMHHLTPGGQVLLWGYGWMVRLFEEACRHLLVVRPGRRGEWLAGHAETSPQAVSLLTPVLDHFGERRVNHLVSALGWCRDYIVRRVAPL